MSVYIGVPDVFDPMALGPGVPAGWTVTFGANGTVRAFNDPPGGIFPLMGDPTRHYWYQFGGAQLRTPNFGPVGGGSLTIPEITVFFGFRMRTANFGGLLSLFGPTILAPPNDELAIVQLILEKDFSISVRTGGTNPPLIGNTGTLARAYQQNIWYYGQLNLAFGDNGSGNIAMQAWLMIDGELVVNGTQTSALISSQFAPISINRAEFTGTGNSQLFQDWSRITIEDAVGLNEYPDAQNIQAVTVTAGGTGYSSSPTIAFSSATGSGATATAIVVAGVITGITVNTKGKGYTTPVTVVITDSTGSGAAAVAVIIQPHQRISQLVTEIGTVPTTGTNRISQLVAEISTLPSTSKVRISQLVIELMTSGGGPTRARRHPEYIKRRGPPANN